MKNKKLLLLLSCFTVIFLTGCTPKFEYDIHDGGIIEKVSVDVGNEHSIEDIKDNANYYGFGSNRNYKIEIKKNDNYQTVTSTGEQNNLDVFFNSENNLFKTCFTQVYYSYNKDEKNYYIGTNEGFNCLDYDYIEYDGFDITIKTFNKVTKHDADEVLFNKYTWHINRDNYKTKKVTFVVGKDKYVWYYKYRFLFGGLAVIAVIVGIVYGIIAIFKRKSDSVNGI